MQNNGSDVNLPGLNFKRPVKTLPPLHRVRSNSIGDIAEAMKVQYENVQDIKKEFLKFSRSISIDPKEHLLAKPQNYVVNVTASSTENSENKNLFEKADHSIKVQITFQSKVSVAKDASLEDLMQSIYSMRIPENMDVLYTDDMGRQRPLNQAKLTKIVQQKSHQTLLCFPEHLEE